MPTVLVCGLRGNSPANQRLLSMTKIFTSKIIILTRNKEKFINKYEWINEYQEIIFLEGDVTSFDFIHDQIDYIIHAAALVSFNKFCPKLSESLPSFISNSLSLILSLFDKFAPFLKNDL